MISNTISKKNFMCVIVRTEKKKGNTTKQHQKKKIQKQKQNTKQKKKNKGMENNACSVFDVSPQKISFVILGVARTNGTIIIYLSIVDKLLQLSFNARFHKNYKKSKNNTPNQTQTQILTQQKSKQQSKQQQSQQTFSGNDNPHIVFYRLICVIYVILFVIGGIDECFDTNHNISNFDSILHLITFVSNGISCILNPTLILLLWLLRQKVKNAFQLFQHSMENRVWLLCVCFFCVCLCVCVFLCIWLSVVFFLCQKVKQSTCNVFAKKNQKKQ